MNLKKNISIFLIAISSLFNGYALPNHAIYISVIELHHSTQTSASSLSIKVFTNDLTDVIRNFEPNSFSSSTSLMDSLNQQRISDYFNQKFRLAINGKSIKLQLRDLKEENDATFIYFHLNAPLVWSDVSIETDYFSELFPDQSNILNIRYNDDSYFARLSRKEPQYSVIFD